MQSNGDRPRWSAVLRALREARGVTLDGWGARLGVSRRTVQRWERGVRAPDPGAEAAILAYCREAGLFRSFERGPLAGVDLTAALLQDLLAEARWRGSGHPSGAAPPDDQPATLRSGDAPHTAAAVPSNLPAQLTSFLGREQELEALRRVQGSTRLLTLTGAGGSGKTRLALVLAVELLSAYPHGVWFVDLAPLADPALVPQTVASTLAIRATGQQSVTEALIDALRVRYGLLLLDNCEHLLPACTALTETLLRACPRLAVLATSRAPLGIGGESVWRVPGMALPPAVENGQPAVGTEVGSYAAVTLFVARAQSVRSDFQLTAENEAAVVEICRQLDGMPLAIEMAAARLNVLSAGQIAERLNDRFRLLTGGDRSALPRHQTLRAAIEWSHDLLTGPEQALLRELSVFAGGFTLEAAEAITSPESLAQDSILDYLAHLVDQSLVIADERNGVVRYRMLETVREYAAEQLTAVDEAGSMRSRHAAWCTTLAEASMRHSTGPEQGRWLAHLTAEHDNIRVALGWCLAEPHATDTGLRLAAAMCWFWEVRGHLGEGRRWLEALLARGENAPPDVRAPTLAQAGWLAQRQGDYDEAMRLHEQSLALRRELGDDAGCASVLNALAVVAGDLGDYDRARSFLEESLTIHRKLGNRRGIAAALNNLGIIARHLRQPERAETLLKEGLAIVRELGDTHTVANGLFNLGNLHRDQGAFERAATYYRESLQLFRELQDRAATARCLEGMATVDTSLGDARRAARLFGAAAALREAAGVPPPPAGRAASDQTMLSVRSALGEAGFAAAWAAGEALSLEEAIAEALAEPAPD